MTVAVMLAGFALALTGWPLGAMLADAAHCRAYRPGGAAMSAEQVEITGPVDLTYREPSGWTSVPQHCATRAQAERSSDATNALSGHSAATRRTWQIKPCACREGGNR